MFVMYYLSFLTSSWTQSVFNVRLTQDFIVFVSAKHPKVILRTPRNYGYKAVFDPSSQ